MALGHLFISEKAIFANWAAQSDGKIQFKYPTWPVKNVTNITDHTPYFMKLKTLKNETLIKVLEISNTTNIGLE